MFYHWTDGSFVLRYAPPGYHLLPRRVMLAFRVVHSYNSTMYNTNTIGIYGIDSFQQNYLKNYRAITIQVAPFDCSLLKNITFHSARGMKQLASLDYNTE